LWIQVGSGRQPVGLHDAAVLIGLMLLPGSWLVLGTALAASLAATFEPRGVLKSAFGVARATAGAVAAAGFLGLSGPSLMDGSALAAIAWAALALVLVDELLTVPVIALATSNPIWPALRLGLVDRIRTASVSFGVAVAAMFAISWEPNSVVLLPALLMLLHVVSANRLQHRAEREAWQGLAQTTNPRRSDSRVSPRRLTKSH
jgi:hypothetical protein